MKFPISKSEFGRLLKQGAVKVNGKKVYDAYTKLKSGDIVKIGKIHFFRVKNENYK